MAGYGQQVRVTGLNETIRSLKKAGVEGSELKQAMSESSHILADELRQSTPVRTGTLASTVKPGKQQRKAIARVGAARPRHYAPFPNFGTAYQPAQQFGARAVAAASLRALRSIEKNINQIINRNGLK